jgi:hypothetical protein
VECCAKWLTYCSNALDLFLEIDGVLNSMEIFVVLKLVCRVNG